MRRFAVGLAALALVIPGCSGQPDGAASPTDSTAPAPTTTTAAVTTTTAPPTTTTEAAATVEMGAQLAARSTCTGCHTVDGSANDLAPTLLGVAGRTVTLEDGSTLIADAGYLRRSIVDPAAQITEGDWPASMPSTYDFSDDELDALVLYLESLVP